MRLRTKGQNNLSDKSLVCLTFELADTFSILVNGYFFSMERQMLQDRALEAMMFPQRCMSINIDGMDQFKTHLPSFAFKDKDGERSKVQVHVTGVLVCLLRCYFAIKCVKSDNSM